MFEGQPKGLYALALANTGERFGYYTMLAVFVLFLQANFGWDEGKAGAVYSAFLAFVYFLPLVGGAIADKIGYGKCVTTGIIVMFLGYLMLAIPAGAGLMGMILMFGALIFVCVGTSLFKGNLQVMVGNLYDDPALQSKRDSAFSIFYMAINIGALFAPTAAVKIMEFATTSLGVSEADAYHYAFGVACISLIVSIAIYYGFRNSFKHADYNSKTEKSVSGHTEPELTPKETKDRVVALCLVFAVVIFFWMAFHQNGLTLTYFARDFTNQHSTGLESMMFDVTNLVCVIFIVYALFSLFQSKTGKGKAISALVIVIAAVILIVKYVNLTPEGVVVTAPIFQQFNPCFVVMLTPVSMAIFGWLASKGKEPSAPRKIGLGMLVAGCGYVVMMIGSMGLEYGGTDRVSPNWLVSTYLILTFGELLLSPMGISFVSKVAPPKYKGLMMGGWFVATAVGNMLVSIPGFLWGNVSLEAVWGILVVLYVLSFLFIFSIMKKLEKVC